jgi:hypothetical protein
VLGRVHGVALEVGMRAQDVFDSHVVILEPYRQIIEVLVEPDTKLSAEMRLPRLLNWYHNRACSTRAKRFWQAY